jgi:hypothetical protein
MSRSSSYTWLPTGRSAARDPQERPLVRAAPARPARASIEASDAWRVVQAFLNGNPYVSGMGITRRGLHAEVRPRTRPATGHDRRPAPRAGARPDLSSPLPPAGRSRTSRWPSKATAETPEPWLSQAWRRPCAAGASGNWCTPSPVNTLALVARRGQRLHGAGAVRDNTPPLVASVRRRLRDARSRDRAAGTVRDEHLAEVIVNGAPATVKGRRSRRGLVGSEPHRRRPRRARASETFRT